jgi:hypothetical protein
MKRKKKTAADNKSISGINPAFRANSSRQTWFKIYPRIADGRYYLAIRIFTIRS